MMSMKYACAICVIIISISIIANCAEYTYEIDCNNLRMGQYICPHPEYDLIDPKTQQPRGCTKENKAKGNEVMFCIIIHIK